MATLVLSAVGAAAGAQVGGAVLGLSGAVIGRAVGATVGRVIDQRLLGLGSRSVDHSRVDRLRITGAGEGVALPRLWGRMRLAGHVIWASNFEEHAGRSRRTKGGLGPRVSEGARYTVSLAIALCEGQITGLGRVWADGEEIDRDTLNLRLYPGTSDQLPDPKIEAIEGAGRAPAYRGTAYVVMEDLDLGPFGNRIPGFSFEVMRAAQAPDQTTLQQAVRAVAWMPGSGEYALATDPVDTDDGLGARRMLNVNSPGGGSDFTASLDSLRNELPAVGSGLLVVSWFGDDLRCADCRIRPKVEAPARNTSQPWAVSGLTRAAAQTLPNLDGAPVYGGTPSDASVLQAIAAMNAADQKVVFYPFILMDQLAGNTLPDPWTGAAGQPPLPWRGRITLSQAPGLPGSPDRSAAAADEVAAFFGTARAQDFTVTPGRVIYIGPDEWSYRRFILHCAALCAASTGVDAFCIGSEMRALSQIRGDGDSFPAVAALIDLARDVRTLLGPSVKLSYAADWSEYSGYRDAAGNRYFHLDPLWADPDIDFIGIDNYMPLSDWRDGDTHLDRVHWPAIHDLDYLKDNVAGGEGFDWFYPDAAARAAQARQPITDGAHDEPWIWRYKDLRAWWENPHHDRIDGQRAATPSPWQPRSKPVWFTEIGCAAIDKGTNQPNKFLDPKSSESSLPWHSTGQRDDLIQMQYLRALAAHWTDPAQNPVSPLYGAPMVDWDRAHVWAWDARPFPWFPGRRDLWSDGDNWARGHWITGRAMNQPLAAVVAEVCAAAGVTAVDVSDLRGLVRGYAIPSTQSGRAALQPLMLAHGFEAIERDGTLVFRMRDGQPLHHIDHDALIARDGGDLETIRAPEPEVPGRVRLNYIEAEGDFDTRTAEVVLPDHDASDTQQSELSLLLTRAEARGIVGRWMAEARVARDVARFSLAPSSPVRAGDVVGLHTAEGLRHYRVDRMELTGAREVEAVRVEPGVYRAADIVEEPTAPRAHAAPAPVLPVFLDLPLMRGDEVAYAPHLAVAARPWPGSVAVYDMNEAGAEPPLNTLISARATLGASMTDLPRARPGLWARADLLVRLPDDLALIPAGRPSVIAGANLMAIGDGETWELFQFADAQPEARGLWRLRDLNRGLFGTDAVAPPVWPAGSTVVRIDSALRQIDLPINLRKVARTYRIGPASRAADDPVHVSRTRAFQGVGLRPYAPVHLRATRAPDGSVAARWIRRTRLDDDWDLFDVPLGEEREQYLIQIHAGGTLRRETRVATADWTYSAADQAADGTGGGFTLRVAQLSDRFGPGPFSETALGQ
ncbi:glycoside hydrolase/phage tail family protein [Pararhodobacter sp. SW119]|uniref:baseplate multidomain protein megatron n=1 Tax=Pararhodobacter sp. SW119 TaxID=2780075 RepID=UPI001ADF8A37|nr:glycoside hydrolase/phage tail family protein [Pararhodobacter sp. SW119]